jgi:ribonucleotide monophosphatase NagD (HAD superfamily)
MHRNLFWKTAEGWELDGGAYIAGLEEAAGVTATICGKPEEAYFSAALDALGVGADRAAMVGDDILNDVVGAKAAGLAGILVQTGKYRPGDEAKHGVEPDHVVDSIAAVPEILAGGRTR